MIFLSRQRRFMMRIEEFYRKSGMTLNVRLVIKKAA
jgi:hypothetical protein